VKRTTQSSQSGSAPTWLVVVLSLVAIGGAAAGVYYWQRTDKLELATQNQQLQTQLQSTATTSSSSSQTLGAQRSLPSTAVVAKQVMTGQVQQEPMMAGTTVACYVLTGSIDTLWVRYGNTLQPKQSTQPIIEDYSQGEPNIYTSYQVPLDMADAQPGTLFSYQCVGSLNRQEFAGGISAFMLQ
jgi:hypothetical protein